MRQILEEDSGDEDLDAEYGGGGGADTDERRGYRGGASTVGSTPNGSAAGGGGGYAAGNAGGGAAVEEPNGAPSQKKLRSPSSASKAKAREEAGGSSFSPTKRSPGDGKGATGGIVIRGTVTALAATFGVVQKGQQGGNIRSPQQQGNSRSPRKTRAVSVAPGSQAATAAAIADVGSASRSPGKAVQARP